MNDTLKPESSEDILHLLLCNLEYPNDTLNSINIHFTNDFRGVLSFSTNIWKLLRFDSDTEWVLLSCNRLRLS